MNSFTPSIFSTDTSAPVRPDQVTPTINPRWMSGETVMSTRPKNTPHLSESAQVDSGSVQPFTRSRKVYVQGSRPDIRVPMREITLDVTPTDFGGEINAPVTVYDTSGPYTDPDVIIDVRKGLADVRSPWIDSRNDTERLAGLSSNFGQQRLTDAELTALRFAHVRNPRRAKASSPRRWNTSPFAKT
jgi:phosphomethylpyrimidine synthase